MSELSKAQARAADPLRDFAADRHGYADEDKGIMSAVARLLTSLVDGEETTNVVSLVR